MTKVKVFVYGRRRRDYDNSSPDFRHGELKIRFDRYSTKDNSVILMLLLFSIKYRYKGWSSCLGLVCGTLKTPMSVRLGYCFTPYQRLWLYNGAPLVAFYDTLGIRRTYSRLKPMAREPDRLHM